jgi:hypothetical protein
MSHSKTLYLREEDRSVWDHADEVAVRIRLPLSELVTQALREHLGRIDQFTDINVEVGNIDGDRWTSVFRGQWIIAPRNDNRWSPRNDPGGAYGVARSADSGLIFYHYHVNDTWAPSLILYPDLEGAAVDLDLEKDAVAVIARKLAQRQTMGAEPSARRLGTRFQGCTGGAPA